MKIFVLVQKLHQVLIWNLISPSSSSIFNQLVVQRHHTLEVFDRLDAQLQRGVLIAYEQRVRVHLESGNGPHVADAVLDGLGQSQRFVGARDENDHLEGKDNEVIPVNSQQSPYLFRVHHSSHAHRQGQMRHLSDVVVEESSVGQNRFLCQRFDTGSRAQT